MVVWHHKRICIAHYLMTLTCISVYFLNLLLYKDKCDYSKGIYLPITHIIHNSCQGILLLQLHRRRVRVCLWEHVVLCLGRKNNKASLGTRQCEGDNDSTCNFFFYPHTIHNPIGDHGVRIAALSTPTSTTPFRNNLLSSLCDLR